MAEKSRFEELHREMRESLRGRTGLEWDIILRDRVTGVLYYQINNHHGSSIIPLLASNGKPIIEPVDD